MSNASLFRRMERAESMMMKATMPRAAAIVEAKLHVERRVGELRVTVGERAKEVR